MTDPTYPMPPVRYPNTRTDDPSALTVKMLLREIENLREVIEARLNGDDKVTVLIQQQNARVAEDARLAVAGLKTHHEEKFLSIQTQFAERDTRTEQTSKDGKVAVDAALQAAKEAVGEQNKSSALAIGKSETATTKQIDQIGITIQSTTSNLNDKIDDVKNRLNVIDGRTKGVTDNKDDHRSNLAVGISLIMAVITVGAMVYAGGKGSPANGSVPAPQLIYVPAPVSAPVVK